MHGNTMEAAGGEKTRNFDHVHEVAGFFEVTAPSGLAPGASTSSSTGDDVTEWIAATATSARAALSDRYETTCDPRLNPSQSLDLPFRVAGLYRHHPAR